MVSPSLGQGQGPRYTKGYPKGYQGPKGFNLVVLLLLLQFGVILASPRLEMEEKAIGASPPVKVTIVTENLDHFKMFFTLIYLFKMLIFHSYVGFTRG